MTLSRSKATGLGLALMAAGNAFALGLGEASGRATLGQPLHLEIPLLGSGGDVPAASCFKLQAPQTDVGNDFAARNGRVQVVGEPGGVKLLVTTAAAVRDPVVGFAVAAGCRYAVAKDYVLLVGLPTATPAAPAVDTPSAVAPQRTAAAAAPAKAGAAENLLRLDAAVTLDALARQKYPLQPKAREKFVRMMRQANPGLTADAGPIAAGTELQMPPGLPLRRIGPYRGEAATAPAGRPAAAALRAAKPDARKAKSGKDRLVLGAAPETNEAKLLTEAERLTTILVEQNKTQDAMAENLARLEGRYGELQKQFTRLQDRLTRIEAERLAEKQAAKSRPFGFVELLLAVLGGGAMGGAALHLYRRRQTRRSHEADDNYAADYAATPVAAAPAPGAAAPTAAPPAPAVPTPILPWTPIAATAEAVAADSAPERDEAAAAAPAATQNVLDFHKP